MSDITITVTPSELVIVNALGASQGVHVGGGVHAPIPNDWLNKVNAGQDVPGCTYFSLGSSGSLVVTSDVQAKLQNASLTQNLDQASVISLQAKVNAVGQVSGSMDVIVG